MLNVSLVFIILLDNPRSRAHRLFALLVFCFVLWNVADIIIINSTTGEGARAGLVMIVAALLSAPAVFLLLSFSFAHATGLYFERWSVTAAVLLPPLVVTVLSALDLFNPLLLYQSSELHVYDYVADIWPNPWAAAMYFVLFAELTWAAVNYAIQFGQAESRMEKRQALHLFFGAAAFALLLIMLNALDTEQRLHFTVARVLTLLITFLFAYAVLGNRIIVLRRIGNRGLAYSIVSGSMFAFYLLVIKHLAGIIGRQLDVSSGVLDGVFILVLAVSFRPLVARVQSLVEQLFYQRSLRYRQSFVQFSHEALGLTRVRDLAAAAAGFLREALSASAVEIALKDEDGKLFRSAIEPDRTWKLSVELQERLEGEHRAVNTDDLRGLCPEGMRSFLKGVEGGYCVPLHAEKGVAGVLLVGRPVSGRLYTADEADFLATFANGVSVVLERNLLIEKMRLEEIRTAKMEKLASLGRLTAGIAHEFRNPLNIISTAAQTILRNPDDPGIHRETASYIVEEADRLNRTVDEFLQFAKPHTPLWETGNLDGVIERVCQALRARAAENDVRVVTNVPASLPEITTSHRHLERALINLGMNAIEAMPRGGTLIVELEPRGGASIRISVRDTGPGIPPEYHARLFDPFFTTKPSGTGLGLVIVYMLVQSVRGTITFETGDAGTAFFIDLPIDGSGPS